MQNDQTPTQPNNLPSNNDQTTPTATQPITTGPLQPIIAPTQPNTPSTTPIITQVSAPVNTDTSVPTTTEPQIAPLFADETVQPQTQDVSAHIEWTASEYIAHTKSSAWYIALGLIAILSALAVYFIAGKDIVSAIVILIVAIAFGVFSARPPQILNYAVDNTGLCIGNKFYPYDSFRSFSVVADGAMTYISLLSLGRFMPPLVIHYEPADESSIAEVLAQYLPYEDHKPDLVDTIARKIRF
ncbi:hypothetical protein KC867_01970 [Candidatus Saccharibacteria bacterium]|nr:hypothetical protein [Candidatus Saccharibacteria bacterium]